MKKLENVIEYTYDALGQLLTETSGRKTTKYEYDNYGNITAKCECNESGEIAEETKITYGYDGTWKDLLTSFKGQSITYDAQGNPINYLGNTLTWEKGRQLKQFVKVDEKDKTDKAVIDYTYNANGIRTSKAIRDVATGASETHTYTLDGTKILRETWTKDNVEHTIIPLYDNEDSVCGIQYNGEPYYFQKNLQGDIIAIVDKNVETVARYSYDAWGVCTIPEDKSECGLATINPYRYRGYYYDTEIGLYYVSSRYYNPENSRWLNGDDVEFISFDNTLLNLDLFVYCKNDPINHTDFDGKAIVTTIVRCVLAALFGLLVQLVSDMIEYAAKKYVLNRTVADQFSPTSPAGDYLGSAVAWALNVLTFHSKIAKIIVPLIPVGVKHVTNLFCDKFKWRDFLIDLGYALITGIVSIALTNAATKQLQALRKYKKRNSRNTKLKAAKKAIKHTLNLRITRVSVTLTSLDTITILILNILLG